MAKFLLEIYTPKEQFFKGEAEAVTCNGYDGEFTVLANHQSMTAALEPGELKIKNDGKWQSAYSADGFMEVHENSVTIFSRICIKPEDIDEVRAKLKVEKENELLRNTESLSEHRRSEIEIQRMLTMLRVKNRNTLNSK
ncbi:MAG: ATP synthase F1 subunit epsilon [Acutalibacteraceae bacterium]